jgi:hypothetical protein
MAVVESDGVYRLMIPPQAQYIQDPRPATAQQTRLHFTNQLTGHKGRGFLG